MNYTEQYRLPQWEESDRILMGDFNQAMGSIEEGLAAAAADKFVVGSYTGNGPSSSDSGQLIAVGFRPRFVIITRGWTGNSGGPGNYFLAVGEHSVENMERLISMEEEGFRVSNYGSGYLTLNTKGVTYDYAAFR